MRGKQMAHLMISALLVTRMNSPQVSTAHSVREQDVPAVGAGVGLVVVQDARTDQVEVHVAQRRWSAGTGDAQVREIQTAWFPVNLGQHSLLP